MTGDKRNNVWTRVIAGILIALFVGGLTWLSTVHASQIRTEGRLATLEAQVPAIAREVTETKETLKEFVRGYQQDQRVYQKDQRDIRKSLNVIMGGPTHD